MRTNTKMNTEVTDDHSQVEAGKGDQLSFKAAEKCLYDYKLNLSRIDTLNRKLNLLETGPALKAQSFEQGYSGGEHSDPVAQRAEKIDSLERRIVELESQTAPITQMVHDLSEEYGLKSSQYKDMLQLLELRYFAGGTWPQVADKLRVSMTSLKDWRHRLVNRAMEYLCL